MGRDHAQVNRQPAVPLSHLELRKYFGYQGFLNGDTAEEVWNLCNAKLQEDSMTVRNLIKQSNVKIHPYLHHR